MSYQIVLLKLLPEKYEADFLDGDLYLNTNSYFTSIEQSDAERFDPHEGIDHSLQVLTVEIQESEGSWLRLPVTSPIGTRIDSSECLNVLCLYMITDRPSDHFDARNLAFGERAIAIGNLPEFIARIEVAAKVAKRPLRYEPIDYVERSKHHGSMGPFKKFNYYVHQNEFRFVLGNGTGEPFRLKIGSIRDIAFAMPTKLVAEFWESMRKVPRADA